MVSVFSEATRISKMRLLAQFLLIFSLGGRGATLLSNTDLVEIDNKVVSTHPYFVFTNIHTHSDQNFESVVLKGAFLGKGFEVLEIARKILTNEIHENKH